ncbi:thioredoxin, putative [unidentified eubacterium SCB49]|nr:thioredoxin, putative [unidentified eubacterium SCB49]
MDIKQTLRKHWSTIALAVIAVLFFIPQTSMPIKVFFNELLAFSPSEIEAEEQEVLANYDWNLIAKNNAINLKQSKGKVVLINMWATWCPPCVAEMPSLQNLYDSYGDQVDFYFVTAEEQKVVDTFMNSKGYTFPVYLQRFNAPGQLQEKSIPTTFLIAKDGKIVIKKTGAADWNSSSTREIIEKLLVAK